MIDRPVYMERLNSFRDTDLIKVITGVRRCGKSTILSLYQELLLHEGIPEECMLYINFEDMDYSHLLSAEALHTFVTAKIRDDTTYYVFLDEVQNVKAFPRAVDSLFTRKQIDLYITGSNAFLLSSELTTLLSGRYIELEILPLSFKEYVSATLPEQSFRSIYNDYIGNSSFPYAHTMRGKRELLLQYLRGLYSTIILRDVVERNNITDVLVLESIVRFLFDSVGSLVSIKKIADTLTSAGRKVSPKTVDKYVRALTHSFIFYRADRFDVRGKEYLKTLEKYYCVNVGMRSILLAPTRPDTGHLLENIIYLELKRRGYRIGVGKFADNEIDFVTFDPAEGYGYYQVAATVQNEETLLRELKPLQLIKDNYPKFLITIDEEDESSYEGRKIMNAFDFLLGG